MPELMIPREEVALCAGLAGHGFKKRSLKLKGISKPVSVRVLTLKTEH